MDNKQQFFDDIAKQLASVEAGFMASASKLIKDKLVKQGIDETDIVVSKDGSSISVQYDTDDEYQAGLTYFNIVYNDLNDNGSWINNL